MAVAATGGTPSPTASERGRGRSLAFWRTGGPKRSTSLTGPRPQADGRAAESEWRPSTPPPPPAPRPLASTNVKRLVSRPISWHLNDHQKLTLMIDDLIHTPGSTPSSASSDDSWPNASSSHAEGALHTRSEPTLASPGPAPSGSFRGLASAASLDSGQAKGPAALFPPSPLGPRRRRQSSVTATFTWDDDDDAVLQDRTANGFRYTTVMHDVRIVRAVDLPPPLDLRIVLAGFVEPALPTIVVSDPQLSVAPPAAGVA